MVKFRRAVALLMLVIVSLWITEGISINAAVNDKPNIKLKFVNDKTGIKISIGKTVGAEGFRIYLRGCGDSYEKYWSFSMKNTNYEIDTLWRNGSKARSYTIKGLPKGSYKITVGALYPNSTNTGYNEVLSDEKTVKIKAVKTSTDTIKYDFSKTKVGDTVKFGHYEQDGIMTNGKEAIEWIVLSKSYNRMLLVSKYALDYLPYNIEHVKITWENCSLRKWLNSSFYKTAFNKTERAMIMSTNLENADNSLYGAEGGNDTVDKVFALSASDMVNTEYGFIDSSHLPDIKRTCAPTAYAKLKGATQSDLDKTSEGLYSCSWLLRSPDTQGFSSSRIATDGYVNDFATTYLDHGGAGVRPALYIILE